MTKRLLALLFAALMIVTCMAGCQSVEEVWESEIVHITKDGDKDTTKTGRTAKTTTGNDTSTDKTTKVRAVAR